MLKYYIMNIVIEQREEIFKDNNTAQTELLLILDKFHKASDTLTINQSLYGDIDLSVLTEYGFKNLKKIIFNKGKITNIINLPNNILELSASDNLLMDINRLPNTLEVLNVENNYISNIDFSELINIKQINISHNNFSTLTNLPTTLTHIECNNNIITYINLFELNSLQRLNASQNKITVIDNLPDNIIELLLDNNPNIQYTNTNVLPQITEKDSQSNYYESLNQYFKLKNDYEVNLLNIKKKLYKRSKNKSNGRKIAASVNAPCIYCKRNVNTLFTIKNKTHKAICGDSINPCPLNIQIFSGDYFNLLNLIESYSDTLRETREEIILLKLDSLFNYFSNQITVNLYDKQLNKYSKESSGFNKLMDKYNELFIFDDNNNKDKYEQIINNNKSIQTNTDLARKLIQDYKYDKNPELLKQALSIQIDDIIPKIKNNNLLQFNNIYIESRMEKNVTEHVLVKVQTSYSNLEYTYGEKPNVISFKIIPSGNTPTYDTENITPQMSSVSYTPSVTPPWPNSPDTPPPRP